jgi:hypothetical protein
MKRSVILVVAAIAGLAALIQVTSCKKETVTNTITNTVKDTIYIPCPVNCDARGNFSGTFVNHLGFSSVFAYKFQDNNFTVGGSTLAGATNAYGGYRNTCDSVIWNSYNTINSSHYIFRGKYSNSRTTLTGQYQNLAMPVEIGTFVLNKQ